MRSMNRLLRRCLACSVSTALAFPCLAAAPKAAPPFDADLAPPAIKHGVECPLPAQGPCVIKKPVGTRYRVLTNNVGLEDMGDYWVADFTKAKDPKSNKQLLRIVGGSGDLHDIEVLFPKEVVVKEKPVMKERPVVKEMPAPKPVEPVKDEAAAGKEEK